MKFIFFIGFVFIFLLSGCSGSGGIMELKGRVYDEDTREIVPNRKVIVSEFINADAKSDSRYIGEFTSDSLGWFYYKLKKSRVTYFYNFEIVGDSEYGVANLKFGMTQLNLFGQFLQLHVRKLTELTLKVERKSKTAFQDTLFVSWQTNKINGKLMYPYQILNYGAASSLPLRWIGGDIKAVVKTRVYADKTTIVYWKLFRQGRLQEFTDTIFCKRGELNSLSFKY